MCASQGSSAFGAGTWCWCCASTSPPSAATSRPPSVATCRPAPPETRDGPPGAILAGRSLPRVRTYRPRTPCCTPGRWRRPSTPCTSRRRSPTRRSHPSQRRPATGDGRRCSGARHTLHAAVRVHTTALGLRLVDDLAGLEDVGALRQGRRGRPCGGRRGLAAAVVAASAGEREGGQDRHERHGESSHSAHGAVTTQARTAR